VVSTVRLIKDSTACVYRATLFSEYYPWSIHLLSIKSIPIRRWI